MTLSYAHRGASGNYPENTMLAFRKAIETGCDGIETDVQMTSDGQLVLMHDEKLRRTTGSAGYLKDHTWKELSSLDAGKWFKGGIYQNERIPMAEELIDLALESNIIINFEIKNSIINYEGIEEKLIELIYRKGMEKRVILSSFNHCSMLKCKKITGEIRTGLLYDGIFYRPSDYAKILSADAIHPEYYGVNRNFINEAHENEIEVNTYTVDDDKAMKYLLSSGVDGIITDYPDRLVKIIQEIK